MWSWFSCHLAGHHEYGVWCEPGKIFLRCVHCGRRSHGWTVDEKPASGARAPTAPAPPKPVLEAIPPRASRARVIPFGRFDPISVAPPGETGTAQAS